MVGCCSLSTSFPVVVGCQAGPGSCVRVADPESGRRLANSLAGSPRATARALHLSGLSRVPPATQKNRSLTDGRQVPFIPAATTPLIGFLPPARWLAFGTPAHPPTSPQLKRRWRQTKKEARTSGPQRARRSSNWATGGGGRKNWQRLSECVSGLGPVRCACVCVCGPIVVSPKEDQLEGVRPRGEPNKTKG